jgi:pentatricopeptide repeat protein
VPVSTYNHLMKEFGKAGCLEGVFAILDAMYAAGNTFKNTPRPLARLAAHPEHMAVALSPARRLSSRTPLPWPKQPIAMLPCCCHIPRTWTPRTFSYHQSTAPAHTLQTS